MRRGREQRHHSVLAVLIAAALLAAGCGKGKTAEDRRYNDVITAIRRADYKSAQSLAEQGNAEWNDRAGSPWHWKYRVALAETLLNVGRAKDAPPLLDPPPPADSNLPEVSCRYKTVLAKALLRLGRASDASSALAEAESCAAAFKLVTLAPDNRMVRYALFETSNQPQKAEEALRSALQLAEEQKDTYWQAIAYNNLGYRRIRGFRYDEALPFLTQAEARFEQLDSKLLASVAQTNIALCASRLGDFDKALATYKSASETQEREGLKLYLQASLGEVGNIYSFQDDPAKAIPYYQRALSLALEINNTSDASKWAGNLASAMSAIGNWEQAEKFNEQSRDLKQRIHDSASLLHVQLNEANIAVGRHDSQRAERLFLDLTSTALHEPSVLWPAHAGLAQLYRSMKDYKRASEHFEAAIRVIEASQSELTMPDYKITFLASLIHFYQSYVDALVERGDNDKALQIAESSRARVLVERLGGRKPSSSSSNAAAYSLAAQRSKSVFLAYWLAPERSFLWVITGQTRRFFVLPPAREIESAVEAYLAFVRNLRDPIESGNPAAERLYNMLLAPARDLVTPGSNVLIVPDGALHNLNFEMLPVPGNPSHYWIEDAVVSVAPSLTARGDVDSGVNLKSILLIGNPESATADYPKLPNAGDEMNHVEERMGGLQKTVYEGADAKPAAYSAANPSSFSAIHFAAHATANSASPMESAIILSPAENSFKLYARDVAQIPLQADLVTISACRGAGARVYSGEGLVGFTWAFLQAGARHVIAGLWDVTDLSTSQLMDHLYENLSAGKSPAAALHEAKLSLIRSPGNFHKPYYWAPFQVYVGYRHD